MRPHQTWMDKSNTHFYEVADRNYMEAIHEAKRTLKDVSSDFRSGYLIHLYTDYLWRERIYTPYFNQYKDSMPRSDLHALYYEEMQQIDKRFLFDLDQVKFYLEQAISKSCDPLLSETEIEKWRLKVLNQDLTLELTNIQELKVFNMTQIQRFIDECSQQIVSQFHEFSN